MITTDGYRLIRVKRCTCGTWDNLHEPTCGLEIDDSREPARTEVAR